MRYPAESRRSSRPSRHWVWWSQVSSMCDRWFNCQFFSQEDFFWIRNIWNQITWVRDIRNRNTWFRNIWNHTQIRKIRNQIESGIFKQNLRVPRKAWRSKCRVRLSDLFAFILEITWVITTSDRLRSPVLSSDDFFEVWASKSRTVGPWRSIKIV